MLQVKTSQVTPFLQFVNLCSYKVSFQIAIQSKEKFCLKRPSTFALFKATKPTLLDQTTKRNCLIQLPSRFCLIQQPSQVCLIWSSFLNLLKFKLDFNG